jgi:hypothetical protein
LRLDSPPETDGLFHSIPDGDFPLPSRNPTVAANQWQVFTAPESRKAGPP